MLKDIRVLLPVYCLDCLDIVDNRTGFWRE